MAINVDQILEVVSSNIVQECLRIWPDTSGISVEIMLMAAAQGVEVAIDDMRRAKIICGENAAERMDIMAARVSMYTTAASIVVAIIKTYKENYDV